VTGRPPRPALRWLTVHAAVVAVLLGLVALPGVGPTPAGVPLLGLGLPWTLLLLVDAGRLYGLPAAGWYVVTLGPAVVNVLLHAVAVRWWGRRRPAV
jgi:hypothetical protein